MPHMMNGWSMRLLGGMPAEVFAPPVARPAATVLFLPGHQQRPAESGGLTAALRRLQTAAVCPIVEHCWWLDRKEPAFDADRTPLEFLRGQVLPFLREQFDADMPEVRLLGAGSGGQGALRLAYLFPREFPTVAAIDPAIDLHLLYGQGSSLDELFPNREAVRQATVTLRLHPLAWPPRQWLAADPAGVWFDGSERLAMKLQSIGIPVQTDFARSADGDPDAYFEQTVDAALAYLARPDRSLPIVS